MHRTDLKVDRFDTAERAFHLSYLQNPTDGVNFSIDFH
jgi:hypothetical protein